MQWFLRYETSSLAGLSAALSNRSRSFLLCFLEVPLLALRDFAWLSVNPMNEARGAVVVAQAAQLRQFAFFQKQND